MIKGVVRTTVPLVALAAGVATFPAQWRKSNLGDRKLLHTNDAVVQQIEKSKEFQQLVNQPGVELVYSSHTFPEQHHGSHVGTALLQGKGLVEIDPITLVDRANHRSRSFYHLGDKLVSQDGGIHNGIVSTVFDDGLVHAGFPLLPSGKGFTAKLSIDFANQAPPQSTVVLNTRVVDHSSRKVVVEGVLETLPEDNNAAPLTIATATAIYVEPRWFKYLSWLQV